MNNTFFIYTVKWCDELKEYEEQTSKGLIAAKSYEEVAQKIEEYYECIVSILIEGVNDDNLLTLEELFDYLEEKET